MLTDSDFASAIIIAIIIMLFALCVWPGFARVKGRSLEGYWAAPRGALYEVQDGGGRSFTVHTSDKMASASGHSTGVRGVSIPALDKSGTVELGSRRIDWSDGDVWMRQGLRH